MRMIKYIILFVIVTIFMIVVAPFGEISVVVGGVIFVIYFVFVYWQIITNMIL